MQSVTHSRFFVFHEPRGWINILLKFGDQIKHRTEIKEKETNLLDGFHILNLRFSLYVNILRKYSRLIGAVFATALSKAINIQRNIFDTTIISIIIVTVNDPSQISVYHTISDQEDL